MKETYETKTEQLRQIIEKIEDGKTGQTNNKKALIFVMQKHY